MTDKTSNTIRNRMSEWRPWTVPNAVSVIRLLGIVPMWWCIFHDLPLGAFLIVVVAGATDWIDGYLARALSQESRVGQLLDPLIDRIYIASTLLGLGWLGYVPWWLLGVVIARDLLLAVAIPLLGGELRAPVTYVGKTATFALMWGFPLLFWSGVGGVAGSVITAIGWAFAVWGIGLYWWAAAQYLARAVRNGGTTRAIR